jgi:ribonuclease inhibitor
MKIILDVLRLQEPEPAHAYLKENLGFPDYYGHNLDALHDCLTEISQETEICLLTREEAGEESVFYGRLLRVFEEAAEENPLLRITEETAAESDFPYEEAYEDNAEDDSVTVSAEDESGPQE